MLRPLLWTPDQVRGDEGVGSEVSFRPEDDVSSFVTLNLFQGP